ncbi:serine--tRNA ligase [Candidatus Bandiella euplotis]|uniref:Serine--tRNA ligase n=1 Tax=Candidatus Bandiella euplotis TaxID=1664265 RepID=A0ABZ0UK17_9RICK|nr:serine--tRNA ligase [Candidatus Bandiella woodruffii]WPX96456.1 Serine--tRNA ligase [Candidatus Bandiella woodruffii]
MHDIKFIRENKKVFDKSMKDRGIHPCADEILFIDEIARESTKKLQDLQHKRNEIAKTMSSLTQTDLEYASLKEQGYEIKHKIHVLEQQKHEAIAKLEHFLLTLPNVLEEDVHYGEGESDNKMVRSVGQPKQFTFDVRSHYEIGEGLKLMDFQTAAKISGSRFVILKKDLVRLERALANFMIDIHTKEFDYDEIAPPALVLEETMLKAGQLPKFEEDSFKTTNGYRLIPTSEVPLVCMVSNEILAEHELPLRYVGYTQCFRSEAGSAGRDTRGMIRQHQFSKVELVSLVLPQNSKDELDRMTNAAETVLQRLELPYKTMLLCSQDIGFCAQKTYDIEVWLPYEKRYREISSCSNCGEFQARRMKARYKSVMDGKNHFIHTLNGSGLAVGRTIVAILENYQNEDGSVNIPTKLQPYMQNQTTICNYK